MGRIISEIKDFYKIIALDPFRQTDGVQFETIPPSLMPNVSSLDIVTHESSAYSPGKVGSIEKPWYMHPHQDDNLIVLKGTRSVEIYKPGFGRSRIIKVQQQSIFIDDVKIYDKPAMLIWFTGVFHRVHSEVHGSISINLAVHYPGFDLKNNFNIYYLNTEDGSYDLLRIGEMDQIAGSVNS